MRAKCTWETRKCSADDSKKKQKPFVESCTMTMHCIHYWTLLISTQTPMQHCWRFELWAQLRNMPGMPVYLEIDDWPGMPSIQVVALSRTIAHVHAFFQHTILSLSNEWKMFHVKAHTEKLSTNIEHPLAWPLNLGSCKVYIQGAESLNLTKKKNSENRSLWVMHTFKEIQACHKCKAKKTT